MLLPPPTNRDVGSDTGLTALITRRWSVRAFDESATVSAADVAALVDAARSAPSAYNLQPWRLFIAERGTAEFGRTIAGLADYNAVWARRAALMVVGIADDGPPGEGPRRWVDYDLGQATALMTVEATARGLGVCQMAGLDQPLLSAEVDCRGGERVAIVSAVGLPAPDVELPPAALALQDRGRERRTRAQIARVALRSES